jgi:hypothetical protein
MMVRVRYVQTAPLIMRVNTLKRSLEEFMARWPYSDICALRRCERAPNGLIVNNRVNLRGVEVSKPLASFLLES